MAVALIVVGFLAVLLLSFHFVGTIVFGKAKPEDFLRENSAQPAKGFP